MKVVLDASAGLAAVLGGEPAIAILEILGRATVVIAPDLFAAEVTSGLWKYVNAGQLSVDDAIDRLTAVLDLVDRHEPVAELAPEVLREASVHRHSPYDLCYAVLARRHGAAVLTRDGRLRTLLATINVPSLL